MRDAGSRRARMRARRRCASATNPRTPSVATDSLQRGKGRKRIATARGSEHRVDHLGELRLRDQPRLRRLHLAVLEQQHRRRRAHAVGDGGLRVPVHLQLGHLQPPAVVGRELFQHRRQRLARAAPFAPEVDEDGGWGLQDVGGEGGVGDGEDIDVH